MINSHDQPHDTVVARRSLDKRAVPPPRTPQRWVALAVALVLSLTVSSCTHAKTHHNPAATPASTSATASTLPPPTARRLALITSALGSTDPATVGTVLDPAVRAGYEAHPLAFLPAGSMITVVPGTTRVSGTTATTTITIAGKAAGKWTLLLVHEADGWLVYGTRKAS